MLYITRSTRFLFLCCSIILAHSTSSSAQIQTLLNDPAINWIGEFTADYSFNSHASHVNEVFKLTKFYSPSSHLENKNILSWIITRLYQDARSGTVQAYSDAALTQLLPPSALKSMISSVDTVTVFNTETFEESVYFVQSDLNSWEIEQLRINQVIYYNEEDQSFNTQIIAVSPMLRIAETGSLKPLFWVKMDYAFPEDFDIHQPTIAWGATAYSKSSPLELNFVGELKNTNNFDFRAKVYQHAVQLIHPVESREGFGSGNFLTKDYINSNYEGIDTIVIFDPNTFEENVKIIKNDLDYTTINQFRLVQEWYYDTEMSRMMNRLKAIGPIVTIKEVDGAYKYSKALFYIRYNSPELKLKKS